jgi:hypothetical protein
MVFKINRKPFNCSVCLAGWFALFLMLFPWLDTPFYMSAAMVAVILLASIMKKI